LIKKTRITFFGQGVS